MTWLLHPVTRASDPEPLPPTGPKKRDLLGYRIPSLEKYGIEAHQPLLVLSLLGLRALYVPHRKYRCYEITRAGQLDRQKKQKPIA